MSTSEFLLKFQIWAIQDNVSDLKKRYLFFSAWIVYAVAISTRLTIDYFDPISKFRQVENPAYLIVYVSLLVGLAFSLISIGFVYVCRSVGIKNLYSSMLFLAILDTFRSVLFEDPLWTGLAGIFFMDTALEFGCVLAGAWLSLRLNRFFFVETPSFKLGYQLGYLVGRVFRFLKIW